MIIYIYISAACGDLYDFCPSLSQYCDKDFPKKYCDKTCQRC